MSTTNGSGEPSMEEILASIRNIIAQDPPSETPADRLRAEGSAATSAAGATVSAAPSGKPAQAAGPSLGGGTGIDLRATAAAGLLPPEPEARAIEPAAPSSTGGSDRSSPAGSREAPVSLKPVADDFSDVFEEPLQRLSLTPSQAGAPEAAAPGRDDTRVVEPQLPRGRSDQQETDSVEEPVLPKLGTAPSPTSASPASQRKEFDFGSLRAPRKEDGKPASASDALLGRDKPVSQEPDQPSPSVFGRLTSNGAKPAAMPEEAAEPPRQKVVIAAMPAAPSTSGAPSKPASPAVQPEATEAPAEGDATAAKTANVGFLAGSSRLGDGAEFRKTIFPKAADNAMTEAGGEEVAAGKSVETALEAAIEELAAEPETVASETAGAAVDEPPAEEQVPEPVAAEADGGGSQGRLASAASLAQGLTAADVVVASQGGTVRTLEDTVSELLRPLLREWLENNMPRIVENALRLEVADSVKKQLKGTPGKPNGVG